VQKRVARAEIDRRVRETAARLRIEPLLARLPAELSGGQQQRTAIAPALAKSAKLVLLDVTALITAERAAGRAPVTHRCTRAAPCRARGVAALRAATAALAAAAPARCW
jgi:ABC-type thiamine transport system ATPase subunit